MPDLGVYIQGMAIPTKGSRKLELDDTTYRYLIKDVGEKTMLGISATKLRVTVQREEDRPGRVMQVTLDSKPYEPDEDVDYERLAPHKASLQPEDVRRMIETGLKKGWDPQARGAAFQLTEPMNFGDYKTES